MSHTVYVIKFKTDFSIFQSEKPGRERWKEKSVLYNYCWHLLRSVPLGIDKGNITGRMAVTVENQYLDKPAEVICCQSESPHGLAWEKTWGLVVRSPQLTAWASKAKRSNKKVGCRGILNLQNMKHKGATVLAGNSESFQTLGSTVLQWLLQLPPTRWNYGIPSNSRLSSTSSSHSKFVITAYNA
jgi:hypothetical protein